MNQSSGMKRASYKAAILYENASALEGSQSPHTLAILNYYRLTYTRIHFPESTQPQRPTKMVKLAGGWIDLNKRYGDMFRGDFNPNICNKNTLKVLGLTHHCKDCKVGTHCDTVCTPCPL